MRRRIGEVAAHDGIDGDGGDAMSEAAPRADGDRNRAPEPHTLSNEKGRQLDRAAAHRKGRDEIYFRFASVRSADSLARNVAPHQLEPKPGAGLMAVTLPGLKAV